MTEELVIFKNFNEQLPEGWEWSLLEKVANVVAGNPAPQGDSFFANGTYPFVRVQDMGRLGSQKQLNQTNDYINDKAIGKLKLFPKGSVLFTKSGASTLLNQRAVLGSDMYVVSHIAAAIPYDGIISEWLYYWLKTIDFNYIAHATTLPSLPLSKARRIPVPIAPENEQKRIVAEIEKQFSRLDEAVDNLKRVKANLKRYKASVLKAAVEGKLTEEWRKEESAALESVNLRLKQIANEREKQYKYQLSEWEKALKKWKSAGKERKKPAKPRKPIEFPDVTKKELIKLPILPYKWTWIRLGNLCADVFDGPFGSSLKSKDYVESGIRVIRLENIGELNFFDEKQTFITKGKYNLLKKHTVGPGDIIFSSFIAGVTRVVVLPDYIDKAINKADCFCIRIYGKTILNNYLACFLSTRTAYYQFENLVHGATRPRINTSQLKDCVIPLPSIIEQKEISNLIAQQFSIIEKLEAALLKHIERAEILRQGILKKAFSGQLLKGNIENISKLA